jgi:HemX protein
VAIYGLSMVFSVFVWRKSFRADNRVNYGLLVAGLALHTVSLAKRGFSFERCPVNNLYEATSFFIWALVAVYAAIGIVSRLRFLGGFVSPLAFAVGVFALMPSLDPPPGPASIFAGGWISLHAAMIMLSYGSFGLSSVAAMMYLTQEHDLKLHKIKAILSKLPSIERIESVVSRLLSAGFALLTIGLLVIPLAVDKPEQISFATDSKVLWSALVWLIYLVLIIWHWRFRLAGKRFAWGALGSFVFVLLTFWGTNLMSQLHN